MGKHREFFVVGMYYHYVKDTLILSWLLFLKTELTLCCAGIMRAQGQWGSRRNPHGKEVHLVKRRGKKKKRRKKTKPRSCRVWKVGMLENFRQKYISDPLVFWWSSVKMTFELFTLQLSQAFASSMRIHTPDEITRQRFCAEWYCLV